MSCLNQLSGKLNKVRRRKKTRYRSYKSDALAVKLEQLEQEEDPDEKKKKRDH